MLCRQINRRAKFKENMWCDAKFNVVDHLFFSHSLICRWKSREQEINYVIGLIYSHALFVSIKNMKPCNPWRENQKMAVSPLALHVHASTNRHSVSPTFDHLKKSISPALKVCYTKSKSSRTRDLDHMCFFFLVLIRKVTGLIWFQKKLHEHSLFGRSCSNNWRWRRLMYPTQSRKLQGLCWMS